MGRFLAVSYAVGYDSYVSIEHETAPFEGDLGLVKRDSDREERPAAARRLAAADQTGPP